MNEILSVIGQYLFLSLYLHEIAFTIFALKNKSYGDSKDKDSMVLQILRK